METLRSGVCLVFELNRPPGACQNKPPNKGHGPEDLVKMADAFYRRVWAKTEKDPPPDGGWLLRLGQGSGAWATSMLLLAEDLDLNYSISPPHTKKMVDGRESLGWVLLSPAGDEAPPAFPQPLPPRPQAATAAPAPAAADGTAEAPAAAAVDGTAEAAQPARGPSPKLQDLLARIGVTKPHDAGRVGMFLDGLQALEDAEKAELARAILNRFGNKLLKRHKRWQELAPYF
jgi:hypothetical protein